MSACRSTASCDEADATGARRRRGGRAPQLRQAGRLSRGAHARRRGAPRTRCRTPSPPRSPTGPRTASRRSPEAWLLDRRAAQADRRGAAAAQTGEERGRASRADRRGTGAAAANEPTFPDERLALMFACAHPAIDAGHPRAADPADVLGFDAATIASAFLVAPATMGQRLVARQEQDPPGRHSVPRAGARRTARAARCGARGDLRGLRRRLVRSGRHRGAPAQPRRGRHLARPARGLAAAGRAGGARPARADAVRRSAARRAARRGTATTCRSPSRTRRVGRGADR